VVSPAPMPGARLLRQRQRAHRLSHGDRVRQAGTDCDLRQGSDQTRTGLCLRPPNRVKSLPVATAASSPRGDMAGPLAFGYFAVARAVLRPLATTRGCASRHV